MLLWNNHMHERVKKTLSMKKKKDNPTKRYQSTTKDDIDTWTKDDIDHTSLSFPTPTILDPSLSQKISIRLPKTKSSK